MILEIKEETWESLAGYYADPDLGLNWPSIFVLPVWLQAWWENFSFDYELLLLSVSREGRLIGIAPLMRKGPVACLVGSSDVCDYLDFITVPGWEKDFFTALFPELKQNGIEHVELKAQRPDAAVFSTLFAGETNLPARAQFCRENESFELALVSTWEDYLAGLKKKQRHEVRRKLRRLENEAGPYNYRVVAESGDVLAFMPRFLDLFQQNPDKENFLTDHMERFFHTMIKNMATAGLARFGLLEAGGITVAAVLYFDYRERIYLYNSGFSSDYKPLSAGLLSKVLCIRDNIEKGRQVFDFLKGSEVYKSRLGGNSIPIYETTITIT